MAQLSRKYGVLGALLVIAATNAWSAFDQEELRRFHLTMMALAVVIAGFVWMSGYEFPERAPTAPSKRLISRRTAITMGVVGAAGALLWVKFGPWEPHADFDVAGFLYVLQNVPQFGVLAVFVVIACVGFGLATSR